MYGIRNRRTQLREPVVPGVGIADEVVAGGCAEGDRAEWVLMVASADVEGLRAMVKAAQRLQIGPSSLPTRAVCGGVVRIASADGRGGAGKGATQLACGDRAAQRSARGVAPPASAVRIGAPPLVLSASDCRSAVWT